MIQPDLSEVQGKDTKKTKILAGTAAQKAHCPLPYLVSRVVPHQRGEKGWVFCYSSGSLEGGCPSLAEVIEDTEEIIQFQGLI